MCGLLRTILCSPLGSLVCLSLSWEFVSRERQRTTNDAHGKAEKTESISWDNTWKKTTTFIQQRSLCVMHSLYLTGCMLILNFSLF